MGKYAAAHGVSMNQNKRFKEFSEHKISDDSIKKTEKKIISSVKENTKPSKFGTPKNNPFKK